MYRSNQTHKSFWSAVSILMFNRKHLTESEINDKKVIIKKACKRNKVFLNYKRRKFIRKSDIF